MSAGSGGASAADMGRDLRGQAARARAARQNGAKVVRGQSETAYKKQAKAWAAGAVGEARGARQLERLRREGYTILHDVLLEPGKKWNLDHLAFGKAGVLFIDDKQWRGRITIYRGALWRHWYGGPSTGKQSEDMTREVTKVAGMAARASARLGVPVRPVICLTGEKSRQFEEIAVVGGVTVLSVDRIVPWLRDHPARLPADQAARWAQIATRLFPPAVPADPASPEALEKARWAAAMRSGGAPSLAPRPAAAPAPSPAAAPPGDPKPTGWLRRPS